MNIQSRLQNVFEIVGIFVNEEDFDKEIEMDSLQFATVIIEVENEFLLRISNDFEEYSVLKTFRDFYKLVSSYFVS
ncbi:MAG: hypothetical protein UFG06_03395 [Lachnospiraceae bacterium]|nr:hypothetical protein [Lachnospiraceae bacterium]